MAAEGAQADVAAQAAQPAVVQLCVADRQVLDALLREAQWTGKRVSCLESRLVPGLQEKNRNYSKKRKEKEHKKKKRKERNRKRQRKEKKAEKKRKAKKKRKEKKSKEQKRRKEKKRKSQVQKQEPMSPRTSTAQSVQTESVTASKPREKAARQPERNASASSCSR